MKKLLAKIMVVMACCIVLMHAMVPHHNMSCGFDGLYMMAPYIHYGMCEENDACYEAPCEDPMNVGLSGCGSHHGHNSSDASSNLCKIQELLSKSLISSNEHDIYTAIECDAEMDLFFDEIAHVAIDNLLLNAHSEWMDYVAVLPIQAVLSDAPLRAPPVC